ncbi:MAG: FAD binding domain-containing protein [Pirellulales bacterium]
MKAFEFAEGRSEAEILEFLSPQPGHTELLAGGTDLVGLMKKMIVTPDRVVSLMRVATMKQIAPQADGGIKIGAAVTLDDVLAHPYMADYPAVLQAIRGINSMQLQAQGTLGGEICQRPRCWYYRNGQCLLSVGTRLGGDTRNAAIFGNAGPAKYVCGSRIAPALIALGAQIRILGPTPRDEKLIELESFYRTPRHEQQRENVLEPNQLVTHVILPPARDVLSATYEVRHGEGPDYPLAAAAAALRVEGGVVREARIVLGQVAPTPWVSHEAAQALVGQPLDQAAAVAAGEAAVARATPLADNQYKVQMAKVAVKRSILLAAGYESGGF